MAALEKESHASNVERLIFTRARSNLSRKKVPSRLFVAKQSRKIPHIREVRSLRISRRGFVSFLTGARNSLTIARLSNVPNDRRSVGTNSHLLVDSSSFWHWGNGKMSRKDAAQGATTPRTKIDYREPCVSPRDK